VLTVRFLMELGLLAAVSLWGFSTGAGAWSSVLGFGAPLLVAVIWGLFVAPKAKWPLPVAARVALELVLFGAGALALAALGSVVLAMSFAVVAVVTSLLNAYYPRDAVSPGGGPR
jgi:hypothetical protein